MLDFYVRLKMFFRKGKKNAKEFAKQIVEAHAIRTLDDIASFITRFRYIPDPLWGLIGIRRDLPAFAKRGGGDCDDFALAVCRLAQALGRKAYYVTGLYKNPFRNHVFAIVRDETPYRFEYRVFTPFTLLPRKYESFERALKGAQILLGEHEKIHVLDVDELK